jgi:hypothetical protein
MALPPRHYEHECAGDGTSCWRQSCALTRTTTRTPPGSRTRRCTRVARATDLGIAIGAGTDVAVEAGDIILLESGPADVLAAIRLSKPTVDIKHHRRVERAPSRVSRALSVRLLLHAACWLGYRRRQLVRPFGWPPRPGC